MITLEMAVQRLEEVLLEYRVSRDSGIGDATMWDGAEKALSECIYLLKNRNILWEDEDRAISVVITHAQQQFNNLYRIDMSQTGTLRGYHDCKRFLNKLSDENLGNY